MKKLLGAIALPLGVSIALSITIGMLVPFVVVNLEDRARVTSAYRVVGGFQAIVFLALLAWAGWRASVRIPGGIGTAALAGVAMAVIVGLVRTAVLFALGGHPSMGPVEPVVLAFLTGGFRGAAFGAIGGLIASRPGAPRHVPLVKIKDFPSRTSAELACESLEKEGIPSWIRSPEVAALRASGSPDGVDLYVDAGNAERATEIMEALFRTP